MVQSFQTAANPTMQLGACRIVDATNKIEVKVDREKIPDCPGKPGQAPGQVKNRSKMRERKEKNNERKSSAKPVKCKQRVHTTV